MQNLTKLAIDHINKQIKEVECQIDLALCRAAYNILSTGKKVSCTFGREYAWALDSLIKRYRHNGWDVEVNFVPNSHYEVSVGISNDFLVKHPGWIPFFPRRNFKKNIA
jgi:hypothetical protein